MNNAHTAAIVMGSVFPGTAAVFDLPNTAAMMEIPETVEMDQVYGCMTAEITNISSRDTVYVDLIS